VLSTREGVLILLPAVLLVTTHFAFQTFVAASGLKLGYLAGFLFYWIVGGFLLSWWLTGTDQLLRLFHDVGRATVQRSTLQALGEPLGEHK